MTEWMNEAFLDRQEVKKEMSLNALHAHFLFPPSHHWTGESRTRRRRRFFFMTAGWRIWQNLQSWKWMMEERECEREAGVESRLACEQHEAQCWETIWIWSWIPGSGSSGGATKHALRDHCTAFRRNTETRSVQADLSHHGDGCRGERQPRDWEGSGHFMAVKTAALKQNHFTASQQFLRRTTQHISSCTWFLHYMPQNSS